MGTTGCAASFRLIHISHSQWLLRNFSLHDWVAGAHHLKEKVEMMAHIEDLQSTDPNWVPDHSRFLLEIVIDHIKASLYDTQAYWVPAIEAARGAQSNTIMKQLVQPLLSTYGYLM